MPIFEGYGAFKNEFALATVKEPSEVHHENIPI